ncbi:MAG TPA: hypothetical protein DCY07_04360 [Rhodospirillaceae bacterium]|nr:hypothetical protein [Rhodospirillaceae bacterium]
MSADDDQDIWNMYARGVKKLGEKEETKEAPPPKSKNIEPPPEKKETATEERAAEEKMETLLAAPRAPSFVPAPAAPSCLYVPPAPPSCPWKKEPLDLRVERNMSLGDVVIEAKLDLHGQTEASAYEAFKDYVETQSKRGKRMLLVITGKGADGASVLRANLPRWCDVPPFDSLVLAVRTAAQHHGGDGAYYVLLRKRGA